MKVAFGRVDALRRVSLRVSHGECVAVIGPSGAGKSTLFSALTRSVAPSGGRVRVHGRNLAGLGADDLRAVRRGIGVIHQSQGLVPQLSAGMNVALGDLAGRSSRAVLRAFLRGPEPDLSRRVSEALDRVGLGDRVGDRAGNLSGGQQQRVAVARLLVHRPSLVLADEPVSSVDPVTGDRVLAALHALAEQGATLIVALHDVERARSFPRVVALRTGAVAFDGPPDALDERRLADVYADEPVAGARAAEPDAELRVALSLEGYGIRAR